MNLENYRAVVKLTNLSCDIRELKILEDMIIHTI